MVYVTKNDRYLRITNGVNENGSEWWSYDFGRKEDATQITEQRAESIVGSLIDELHIDRGISLSIAKKQYQIVLA